MRVACLHRSVPRHGAAGGYVLDRDHAGRGRHVDQGPSHRQRRPLQGGQVRGGHRRRLLVTPHALNTLEHQGRFQHVLMVVEGRLHAAGQAHQSLPPHTPRRPVLHHHRGADTARTPHEGVPVPVQAAAPLPTVLHHDLHGHLERVNSPCRQRQHTRPVRDSHRRGPGRRHRRQQRLRRHEPAPRRIIQRDTTNVVLRRHLGHLR